MTVLLFLGCKSIQYQHWHAYLAVILDGGRLRLSYDSIPRYIFKDNLRMALLTFVLSRVACLGFEEVGTLHTLAVSIGIFFYVHSAYASMSYHGGLLVVVTPFCGK